MDVVDDLLCQPSVKLRWGRVLALDGVKIDP